MGYLLALAVIAALACAAWALAERSARHAAEVATAEARSASAAIRLLLDAEKTGHAQDWVTRESERTRLEAVVTGLHAELREALADLDACRDPDAIRARLQRLLEPLA